MKCFRLKKMITLHRIKELLPIPGRSGSVRDSITRHCGSYIPIDDTENCAERDAVVIISDNPEFCYCLDVGWWDSLKSQEQKLFLKPKGGRRYGYKKMNYKRERGVTNGRFTHF